MTFIRDWFLFKLPNFDLIRLSAFEHYDDKSRHPQKFNGIHFSKWATQLKHIVVYSCDLIMCCLCCSSYLHDAILKYDNLPFSIEWKDMLRRCCGSCNIHSSKIVTSTNFNKIYLKIKQSPLKKFIFKIITWRFRIII